MPGRLRRRRRAARLDEAGRLGRRRGRDGRPPGAPLPGDDLMQRRRPAPDRALRGTQRRPAPGAGRGRDRGRGRAGHGGSSGRASRPTSGGCCWTGAIDLVRRTGREDTVVARMDAARPLGRRVPGLGRARHLSGHRPAAPTPAGCCGCPATVLRDWLAERVPVRRPPDQGIYRTARGDRGDGAAAQRPGRPWARWRPGWRTRSTTRRRRRPARSTPWHGACATVEASLGALARNGITAGQFAALDALRGELAPPTGELDPLARSDQEEELADWLDRRRGRARPGRWPSPWPRPAWTWSGASGWPRCSGRRARAGAGVGGRDASRSPGCSPRSRSRSAGSPSWSARSARTRRWTGPRCSRPTSPRGSRARW